ncbi:MAG: type II 3-dehydroquinate dehydratase [Actinobacteria bacterium]|nr:type II 3-dehydroquinate dehydratase [Actinomycetota bacterium]
MAKVLVLNGPNLNRLGSREPDVYGTGSYEELGGALAALASELGVDIDMRQTNDESEMLSWLHEAADGSTPVILNPAAFTHYSYSLRDACALLTAPMIEVHLSNPLAREEFRHTSVVSGVATGTISGLGFDSYLLALRAIAARV